MKNTTHTYEAYQLLKTRGVKDMTGWKEYDLSDDEMNGHEALIKDFDYILEQSDIDWTDEPLEELEKEFYNFEPLKDIILEKLYQMGVEVIEENLTGIKRLDGLVLIKAE